ncbi:MAG: hypothetical protein DMF82_20805 [Acidobacteria bacterium]|nr:MAG: hypothetical protein DMF82_20805 [Acidobacteriota bacterium]
MRWRRVGAVLGSVAAALGAVVAVTGVMVVDVTKADGTRVVLPVPLLLAQAAARFGPTRTAAAEVDRQIARVRQYLPVAEEVLAAVAETPDCELASVDQGDEHVRVYKVGPSLQIRVDNPRENTELNVPFNLARRGLQQARQGRVSPAAMLAMLRHSRLTQLVDVYKSGGDHVKIKIW